VDAIVSSSPWETVHLVASRLSKLHHVGWVADFRDPWTQASWNPRHPAPLARLNFLMEGMTLRRADGVVVTSRTTADGLVESHRSLDGLGERIHVIYNGYDEADFDGVAPRRFDRFTIVYSGRAVMPGRTPEPLFAALARLVARRPELAAKVQVMFVGALSSEADALVARYRLNEMVRFAGYLPHRESVSYICGADMLYLNTIPECIPGKFPEYLRAGRPILGVMPPACEVAGLIRDWHAGVVVAAEDEEGLARTIESRIDGAAGSGAHNPDVERLSRRRLTGQLAELLDRVSGPRRERRVNV
jgi:glycosyltransferase involved in cell wall biosynthesis